MFEDPKDPKPRYFLVTYTAVVEAADEEEACSSMHDSTDFSTEAVECDEDGNPLDEEVA